LWVCSGSALFKFRDRDEKQESPSCVFRPEFLGLRYPFSVGSGAKIINHDTTTFFPSLQVRTRVPWTINDTDLPERKLQATQAWTTTFIESGSIDASTREEPVIIDQQANSDRLVKGGGLGSPNVKTQIIGQTTLRTTGLFNCETAITSNVVECKS
jgi:hypothetical protein